MKNVQRDDYLPIPINDVMRDELISREDYRLWRSRIAPTFEARMLAVAAALLGPLGSERVRRFCEETYEEAFLWIEEASTETSLDTRGSE